MMNSPSPSRPSAPRSTGRLRWLALLASAFLLIGFTACSSDSNASAKSSTTEKDAVDATPAKSGGGADIANAMTITAPGMSYDVSGDLRPGVAAITFKNTDDESHMMVVARLNDGVTRDQFEKALESPDESAVNSLLADPQDTGYGTPAELGPGQQSTVITQNLKEGNYATICFFTTDDGTPHFAMGMIGEFKVTGEPSTDEKPDSDGTITIDDKAITMPDGFEGKGTFAVENTGAKVHNIQLVKLDDGATIEGYLQGVNEMMGNGKSVDNAKGGLLMGGVDVVEPGQMVWLELDLPAGNYGYLSTEDAQDSPKPPTQIGEFTVS
jgi:hypothetical protein